MDARKKLELIAEAIVNDLDSEGHADADLSYDLWTEELRNSTGTREQVGVIDMGEMYQGTFIWDGREWIQEIGDEYEPPKIIDRIIKVREFNRSF